MICLFLENTFLIFQDGRQFEMSGERSLHCGIAVAPVTQWHFYGTAFHITLSSGREWIFRFFPPALRGDLVGRTFHNYKLCKF